MHLLMTVPKQTNSFAQFYLCPSDGFASCSGLTDSGADIWGHFPRFTDAASGGALHASLPGATNVLTPSG